MYYHREMIKDVGDGVNVCLTSLFNHIFIHRQSTRWLASIIHHQYFQRKRRCFILWKLEFGFMPARCTSDAIFIIRQLQENYLQMKENNYFAFVDLEKAFDHVPRVIWWEIQKLILNWKDYSVKSDYGNACWNYGNSYSNPVNVWAGSGALVQSDEWNRTFWNF